MKENAAQSSSSADTARIAAQSAQSAAETAQRLSEDAKDASVTAKNASQAAQALAETAQTGAETAQTAAEAAQTAAETAQGLAETAVSHYPRVNSSDHWELWNVAQQTWQDSGHESLLSVSAVTEYQNSTSGTIVPTGTWSPTPNPQQGRYMWARTTYTWSNNTTNVVYVVSHIGANGTGTVDSVNGLSGDVVIDGKIIYVDEAAAQPETLYAAVQRLGTSITTSEINALFV